LKEACPPHKLKDLDALYKSLSGDEAKIRERISEWWDEPYDGPHEEAWEDVNKKHPKKIIGKYPSVASGRGGRVSDRGGRGRSGGRSGREGGRTSTTGGRGGRDGRGPRVAPVEASEEIQPEGTASPTAAAPTSAASKAPQGAWAKKESTPSSELVPETTPMVEPPAPEPPAAAVLNTVIAPPAPTVPVPAPQIKPVRPAGPPGNVWATRGSAHLIQAEKPRHSQPVLTPFTVAPPTMSTPTPVAPMKPPTPPVTESLSMSPPTPTPVSLDSSPTVEVSSGPSALETVASLNSSSVAVGARGPSPVITQEAPPPAPPVAPPAPAPWEPSEDIPLAPPPPREVPMPPAPPPVAPAPPKPSTMSVLNMGHWEAADADDSNLDFGFGSFGNDNDVGGSSLDTGVQASSVANLQHQASSAPKEPPSSQPSATAPSPARPPPGLSIGGMPPMPANAVLVHELENKLEEVSLANKSSSPVPPTNTLPPPPQHDIVPSHLPSHLPYNTQYGGMGMYNYTAAGAPGNAFIGVPGPLGGGVVPPQQQKPQPPQSLPQQQGGLYGSSSAPTSGNASGTAANTHTDSGPTTAVPPGMPNIPVHPAMYYGQQPFHPMGQHQGGIGYNYGYGAQFGGAVQGAFGYPQAMGQSGGYGPPYDDQTASHHTGGTGGYQKNTGGYRGRNQHHNSNQYQNQYTPQQHAGYGGQPYGMGYHGDHFNQRGGYGQHGGMQDPYGMQQQQQQQQQQQGTGNYGGGGGGGGFQEDDQYKSKKGGRAGLQQFQQQGPPPHLGGGQQTFGLQNQGTDSNHQSSGSGWSNQGGWPSGAPSWQGK
jgi:hypothetical protein